MAADWIKIEHGLLGKPEVMRLCDLLDCGPHEVVGHLVAFWLWCDANMSSFCPRVMGTKRGLDAVSGRDGFCDAMISVGWLHVENGEVWVPNYETHLSQSAKQRAREQRKKALQRAGMSPNNGDKSGTQQGTQQGTDLGTKTGPEKRREEKSVKTPLIPQRGEAGEGVPPLKTRRNSETVGQWDIPSGWDSPKLRDALNAFERMRAGTGKRIKDRSNLSRSFKSYDNANHLIYALEFATANEYQGIKTDYRPPVGQEVKKRDDGPPLITEIPPGVQAYYERLEKQRAEKERARREQELEAGHDGAMRGGTDLRDTHQAV